MAQQYAIINADGVFTGRTYSDADIPVKTSENWPGSLAEPSAYHKPIPDPPDDLHTWDEEVNGWILPDSVLTGLKEATIQRVKSLGEQRVYSEYGPHAQARLGVSKDEPARAACHELIERVRGIIDATEAAILAATTVVKVKEAENGVTGALEGV